MNKKQITLIGLVTLMLSAAGWLFMRSNMNNPNEISVAPAASSTIYTTDHVASETEATSTTYAQDEINIPTRTDREIDENLAKLGYTRDDVKIYRSDKYAFEFMILDHEKPAKDSVSEIKICSDNSNGSKPLSIYCAENITI